MQARNVRYPIRAAGFKESKLKYDRERPISALLHGYITMMYKRVAF